MHAAVRAGLRRLNDGQAAPTHTVAAHASFVVHASPSLHAAVLAGFVQPVEVLHTSSVHTLPSLQAALFATWLQLSVVSLQESVVHEKASAQFGAVPAWQVEVPRLQVSWPLHHKPSSHCVLVVQPVTGGV